MIKDLRLSKNRAVCSYFENGQRQYVSWGCLRATFEYAYPSQLEYLSVHVSNDDRYLIIFMTLFSDQCGRLFIWDIENRTIKWERDTPYISACEVVDTKAYVAYSVHNYATRPFTYIESIDIQTGVVTEYDKRFPSPNERESIAFSINSKKVCLMINGEQIIVDNA